ncbi:uncharacterized protein LOC144104739 [Amblyomma americanum]
MMNLVEAEDVLCGELGRYVKFVGCVVGFDGDQLMAIVQDSRRNKVPVRLLPTENCLGVHRFQVCMFTGIIARRYDNGDERCLQMLNFMQVHYGLSLNEFEDVQRLRRNILHECSAVNAKVANKVLLDLCDKFEFVVDDWNECLDMVVNHSDSCGQCTMNGDFIPLQEFVSGSCDDPRVKCLTPLPVIYADIVKQVFKDLGEERYTSLIVRRLLDGLLA